MQSNIGQGSYLSPYLALVASYLVLLASHLVALSLECLLLLLLIALLGCMQIAGDAPGMSPSLAFVRCCAHSCGCQVAVIVILEYLWTQIT